MGIAGGTDTVSDAPIVYPDDYRRVLLDMHGARSFMDRLKPMLRIRPRHFKPVLPGVKEPRTGLSMGESMEITAKRWDVQREHQDQLALSSHIKAAAAYDAGFYDDLVVPFQDAEEDNNVRRDTTFEKLSTLRPVFDKSEEGTMTAGNSTPLTDGAAAVLLASEDWARQKNLPVQAYLTFAKVAAVDFIESEGLLMAPAYAVSDLLDAGLAISPATMTALRRQLGITIAAFAIGGLALAALQSDPAFAGDDANTHGPGHAGHGPHRPL